MQLGRRPDLNPKTYRSPSGTCTLFVDPSQQYGAGEAMYRVMRGARLLWQGKRPWTLWDARIADDGTVGGYGFTKGAGSYSGELVVALLDPFGGTLLERREKQGPQRYFHGPATPTPEGLFLDPENDRFVVRVAGERDGEAWRSYSLVTGKERPRFTPRSEDNASLSDARPVRGTPLTLLFWRRYVYGEPGQHGAVFTLIDRAGKTVWRLALPKDYNVSGGEKAEEKLREELDRDGAILRADTPRAFTLRHVANRQAVNYTVEARGDAWEVRETGRAPYVSIVPQPIVFDAPTARFPLRATVTLQAPGDRARPAIRSIRQTVAAGPGRLAFVRVETPAALVVVSERGAVLAEVRLDAIRPTENDRLAALVWQGGDRYLVFFERWPGPDSPSVTAAFRIDAKAKTVAPLPGYRGPSLRKATPRSDGGFVALGDTGAVLLACDRNGRTLWRKEFDDFRGKEDLKALLHPESVAVLRDGTIAVLDNTLHRVVLFTASGAYRATIELDKAWKREAEYPTDIFALPDGGFAVHDYPATPSVYLMDRSGRVRRTVTLRHPGYTAGEPIDVLIDHAGDVWACEHDSLFLLDRSGRAVRRIGEAPRAGVLRNVGEAAALEDGTLVAMDERTGVAHVFDPQGRWRAVCAPSRGAQEKPERFDREGELERGPGGTFSVAGRWFASSGRPIARPAGFRTVAERAEPIRRRPDNTWFEPFDRNIPVSAPDGPFALADARLTEVPRLSLFAADDRPERVLRLPKAFAFCPFAYDGSLVVIGTESAACAYRATGEPLWKLPLPKREEGHYWRPFLIEGGKVLCLYDGARTVLRYALSSEAT